MNEITSTTEPAKKIIAPAILLIFFFFHLPQLFTFINKRKEQTRACTFIIHVYVAIFFCRFFSTAIFTEKYEKLGHKCAEDRLLEKVDVIAFSSENL